MEIELWWLLALPLFFALGWLAARIDIRQIVSESRMLPQSYLTGLNFLLNEQPDKAIDAFIEAVKIDPQTVELHFALGSLFRRRGEVERAIRIHQNLIDRDDIAPPERIEALTALGQDYLKAGLLDRAESVFLKLREHPPEAENATRHLLAIYQQEKSWPQAIDIAHSLPDSQSMHWRRELAQFYCEQAQMALANSDAPAARQHIEAALATNPRCVRASILLGDSHIASGDTEGAIEAWKHIEHQDPACLALVGERVINAFEQLGRAGQGQTLLSAWLDLNPSLDLLDQVFRHALSENGPRAAYDLVREELKRNPTLIGLSKFLEAAINHAPPEQRTDIELVRQIIIEHTRRVARYRCDACGFKSRQFQWHCPACGGWETYPPRRTEEFDLAP